MRVLFTLALKDLRVLSRDRMALFWALGFPVLFAMFFGSIMKAGAELETPSVPVVLVVDPTAPTPERIVLLARALTDTGLRVTTAPRAQAAR